MREHSQLTEIITAHRRCEDLLNQVEEAELLLRAESGAEMKELIKDELKNLHASLTDMQDRLKFLLIPKDPLDEKNIIMEIRGGA